MSKAITSCLAVTIVVALTVLSGCASQRHSTYRQQGGIIIDTKGVDMAKYHQDLQECRGYAAEVPVAERAATSAAGGAAVGAVFGAIVGDSDTAKRGAGVGAVGGGLKGAASGYREREVVVKRCLSGRGYRVLN